MDGLVSVPGNTDGLFGGVYQRNGKVKPLRTELTNTTRGWNGFDPFDLNAFLEDGRVSVALLTFSLCDCWSSDYDIAKVGLLYDYGVLE